MDCTGAADLCGLPVREYCMSPPVDAVSSAISLSSYFVLFAALLLIDSILLTVASVVSLFTVLDLSFASFVFVLLLLLLSDRSASCVGDCAGDDALLGVEVDTSSISFWYCFCL